MSKRVAKLIMVTAANNNKFYDMVENDDGSISIDFGRVGVTSTKLTYPLGKKKWESLYNEKVKKGYIDQTSLRVVSQPGAKFAVIPDTKVHLQGFANQSVQDNYTVTSEVVTQAQIDTAQLILDKLVSLLFPGSPTKQINDALLNLYGVIPRRMSHVQKHLIQDAKVTAANLEVINKMVATEQATLDVMRGQVNTNQVQQGNAQPSKTVLDALGCFWLSYCPSKKTRSVFELDF
jgi:poly [ADP-ribose] polymerase